MVQTTQPSWVEEVQVYVAPTMNPRSFRELLDQAEIATKEEVNILGGVIAGFQAQFDSMRADFQRQFDEWKSQAISAAARR